MTSVGATQTMSSLLGGPDAVPDDRRAIPDGVNYVAIPPLGKRASATMRRFRPSTGQQYAPRGSNVIRIPINTTGFMDMQHSHLEMEVTCRCAALSALQNEGFPTPVGTQFDRHRAVFALDGGAHALIRRIRIEGSDGNELERIENVNILAHALADAHLPNDYVDSYGNIQEGMDVSNSAEQGDGNRGPVTLGRINGQVNGGRLRFAFAPLSGILMSKKYLPLFAVRGGGVIIEITLESADRAFRAIPIGAGGAYDTLTTNEDTPVATVRYEMDYQVERVEYVGKVIDFTEDFNQEFVSMLRQNGGLQIPTVTYYNHPQTMQPDQGVQVFTIAERAHSLKSILALPMLPQRRIEQDSALQKLLSARPFPGITQWQFRVGAISFPQQPVVNHAGQVSNNLCRLWAQAAGTGTGNPVQQIKIGREASASFNELLKSFNRIFDIESGGRISAHQYTCPGYGAPLATLINHGNNGIGTGLIKNLSVAQAPGGPNPFGVLAYKDIGAKHMLGLDFEAFAQDNDTLSSGLDTASTALPIDLQIERVSAAAINQELDIDFADPVGSADVGDIDTFAGVSQQYFLTEGERKQVYSQFPNTPRELQIYCMVDLLITLDSEGFLYTAK